MEKYVGLDLSFSCSGIYVLSEDGVGVTKTIKTKPIDWGDDIERAEYISNLIKEQMLEVKPTLIMIEAFFVGQNAKTVIKLAKLGVLVRKAVLDCGFSVIDVAPTQLKKFVTGKGSGPKDNILKEVFKRFGVDVTSNDLADAAGLAYLARLYCSYKKDSGYKMFGYEKEVLDKLVVDGQIYKIRETK